MRLLACFFFLSLRASFAQTPPPPALLENLPAGASQTVLQQSGETCLFDGGPVCLDQQFLGDPKVIDGALGGNRYDRDGNLFVSGSPCPTGRRCLWLMTPEGEFRKVAEGPVERRCEELSPGNFLFMSAGISTFSFNPAQKVNALYVVTVANNVEITASCGTCNPDGTFTGTVTAGSSVQTTALVRVDFHPRGPRP